MSNPAGPERIESNLNIIRTYLESKFPNYTLTEVFSLNEYYMFTVTNVGLHESYKLMVDGPRLSGMRLYSTILHPPATNGAIKKPLKSQGFRG
jgi:hypothetical protein